MAKKRLIKEPISTSQIDPESLLAMMLKYHKALAKETREDERALRAAMKIELEAKATKVALDNAMIDQLMAEAKERADRAMKAATAAMLIGIVRGDANAVGDWTITVPFDDFGEAGNDQDSERLAHLLGSRSTIGFVC